VGSGNCGVQVSHINRIFACHELWCQQLLQDSSGQCCRNIVVAPMIKLPSIMVLVRNFAVNVAQVHDRDFMPIAYRHNVDGVTCAKLGSRMPHV
jgi:hypothetical protein